MSPLSVTPKPTISPASLIPKAVSNAANGESVGRKLLRSVTPPSAPLVHRTALGFPVAGPPRLIDAPTTRPRLLIANPAPTTSPGSNARCWSPFALVQMKGSLTSSPGSAEVPTTAPWLLIATAAFPTASIDGLEGPPKPPKSTTDPSASHKTACGPATKGGMTVFPHLPETPTAWPTSLI